MSSSARVVDLIDRKRRGHALDWAEIDRLISAYVGGQIPDYQMAALLMAIVWRGMTPEETTNLTLAMAASGAMLDLSDVAPVVVDKHSTGGVGDKTTLVVAPLVAACGVHVGKMSGRGLGHTGGTIDKLESIAGFTANLDATHFMRLLAEHRLVLAGQSVDLAPADGLLYALRDATATVESIPLIASSIMSKKLAVGATHILLDVKVGRGAFMRDHHAARELACLMVEIGNRAGRRTEAVLSAMDQPLGQAIGNALEVAEAIATLRGDGPPDLTELCLHEAATLLALAGAARDAEEGLARTRQMMTTGAGLEKFAAIVAAQGGDERQIWQPERLPAAPVMRELAAPATAHVQSLDAQALGLAAMRLGAGRRQKDDPIDHRVGIVLRVKVGERVMAGAPLATIHAATEEAADQAGHGVLAACQWSEAPVPALPLILGHVNQPDA